LFKKKNISDIGYFVIDILPMRKSERSLCSRQKAADLANRMACGAFPRFWGVPENGGTPIAGWFIRENPSYHWRIWGYP
jgi:hypothetical protein